MAFLVALNFAQSSGLPDVLALLYFLCLARSRIFLFSYLSTGAEENHKVTSKTASC